ncbi:RHS repeat-associated core domain-containing protein, partial [Aeromonas veronii]|uniref:RHS repeat-associated core domain-containing protein n=1 Tax=Aeromonas veronii TaxID=654 RepID=UPI00301E5BED
ATPLRFQGQYFDAETGLHYNRHRYYQPETGRFITPDPVGLLGGLNVYRYGINPLRWVDPSGLSGVDGVCPSAKQTTYKPNNTANAVKPADIPITQEKYDEIINLERGYRPENPRSYLPDEYVTAHEKLFEEQGGGFIQVADWLNPDSRYKSLPNGKFVGLNSEVESIATKASKFEDPMEKARFLNEKLALGLDNDGLKVVANSELYYIRIKPNDPRFSYKMPTGNEPGALQNEWVPGGKTKGGLSEAALDGANQIKHDGDINKLLSLFDDSTKI